MTETTQTNFKLNNSKKMRESFVIKKQARPLNAAEKWMDGFDSFPARVPGFNFEGRRAVHSPVGVFLTFILTSMLIGIFCLRF